MFLVHVCDTCVEMVQYGVYKTVGTAAIFTFKESRAGLVQNVLLLEGSHSTIVWTKPCFLLPKKYKVKMEVDVNNSR